MKNCTIQTIQAAVDKFVKKEETFSAYDVVKFLRERKFYATRDTVNPIVHNHMDIAMNNGSADYNKADNGTYIEYSPKMRPAATTANGTYVSTNPVNVTVFKPTAPQNQKPNTTQMVMGTVGTGSEGRINLSKSFMEAIGVKPGSETFVYEQNGVIQVQDCGGSSFLATTQPNTKVRKIKTDNHNNLRIRTKSKKNSYIVSTVGKVLYLS